MEIFAMNKILQHNSRHTELHPTLTGNNYDAAINKHIKKQQLHDCVMFNIVRSVHSNVALIK